MTTLPPVSFPTELSVTYRVQFDGPHNMTTVATGENGDIFVHLEDENGFRYTVFDTDEDFWIGAAYVHYGFSNETSWWSNEDWKRVAQCCTLLQIVPSLSYLMKVCGITSQGRPYSYDEMKRQMDLVDFANNSNREFKEGSD